VLGRPDADEAETAALAAGLGPLISASPVFNVPGQTAGHDPRPVVARVQADDAAQLELDETTLFVVGPVGFIGLRARAGEALDALATYDALVRAGGRRRKPPTA
jgi:hypothetical protein